MHQKLTRLEPSSRALGCCLSIAPLEIVNTNVERTTEELRT